MTNRVFSLLFVLLLLACEGENPNPISFLDYEYPNAEYFEVAKLEELNKQIKEGAFGDIHSLVILRSDKIVFENYYSNYQRSDLHPIGAATQGVVSALMGAMALEDDAINLNARIIDLLPEYQQYFSDIPQKDQIEIRHLMSNTSGLWWDEWTHPFGSEDNDAYVMTQSGDWIANVLSTPMIREPGFEFNYNSGNGILMAPIMQNLTGVELEQYATEKLFNPLDISRWKWERIPGDFVNTSWGLHLRPMDFAKIGYLFLQQGIWNEQSVFDENWRRRSSRFRVSISNYYNYGYFWWSFSALADVVFRLKQNDVFFSWGDGGQFLFIIPHLDMVIVTTAGNYSSNDIQALNMLKDYIFDAVLDRYQ